MQKMTIIYEEGGEHGNDLVNLITWMMNGIR